MKSLLLPLLALAVPAFSQNHQITAKIKLDDLEHVMTFVVGDGGTADYMMGGDRPLRAGGADYGKWTAHVVCTETGGGEGKPAKFSCQFEANAATDAKKRKSLSHKAEVAGTPGVQVLLDEPGRRIEVAIGGPLSRPFGDAGRGTLHRLKLSGRFASKTAVGELVLADSQQGHWKKPPFTSVDCLPAENPNNGRVWIQCSLSASSGETHERTMTFQTTFWADRGVQYALAADADRRFELALGAR